MGYIEGYLALWILVWFGHVESQQGIYSPSFLPVVGVMC